MKCPSPASVRGILKKGVHVGQQVTNYICLNCGGPVHFDADTGKVKCDYCDSLFTIEEVKRYYEERNKKAKAAAAEAGGAGAKAEDLGAEAPNVETAAGDDWSGEANLKVYHCGNCGAELIADASTAATTCPYCGNPTVIPGQFSVGRRPDYIIPFSSKKETAIEKLKDYYKGKLLLPKSFTQGNHLQEIKGVYVPYWLFGGSVDADMSFECGKSTVTVEGDFEVTRTRLYDVQRAGTMTFDKIPCDASASMPDDLMDSIEPYDYAKLTGFELEYLPGFLANKYDVEADKLQKKADERAKETTYTELQSSISGYDSVQQRSQKAVVHHGKTDYALMPVWLLYTRWNEQDFLFAMNGQTGKMTGNLPVSKGKTAAWFAGIGAAAFAFFMAVAMLCMGAEDTGTAAVISAVLAVVIGGISVGIMMGQMKPVEAARAAGHYLVRDQSQITVQKDRYIRTVESRKRIQKPQQQGGPGARRPK